MRQVLGRTSDVVVRSHRHLIQYFTLLPSTHVTVVRCSYRCQLPVAVQTYDSIYTEHISVIGCFCCGRFRVLNIHSSLDRDFGKCWPIKKILSLFYSAINLQQDRGHCYISHCTLSMSLHYLGKLLLQTRSAFSNLLMMSHMSTWFPPSHGTDGNWIWIKNWNGSRNGNTTTWEWERLMLVGSRGLVKSRYTTLCALCGFYAKTQSWLISVFCNTMGIVLKMLLVKLLCCDLWEIVL